MELIYKFPAFGGMFHDVPLELDTVLRYLFIQCQDIAAANLSMNQRCSQGEIQTKTRLDIKFINVPPTSEVLAESIRCLSSRHLNKLIIIFGTVVRTGNVNSREL